MAESAAGIEARRRRDHLGAHHARAPAGEGVRPRRAPRACARAPRCAVRPGRCSSARRARRRPGLSAAARRVGPRFACTRGVPAVGARRRRRRDHGGHTARGRVGTAAPVARAGSSRSPRRAHRAREHAEEACVYSPHSSVRRVVRGGHGRRGSGQESTGPCSAQSTRPGEGGAHRALHARRRPRRGRLLGAEEPACSRAPAVRDHGAPQEALREGRTRRRSSPKPRSTSRSTRWSISSHASRSAASLATTCVTATGT